jgi:hypothetical protein
LAYLEEIIMLSCDNKPYIYLGLQINGDTLDVNNLLFGIIPVSLSRKTIQSNTQNLCLSPLMLVNSLPLSGNTLAGANVLLRGVDPGFHSVPLHHINLKSDFVSGQDVVGVRPTLPVEDISLLFGIDMAGHKVIMAPKISEEPSYEENEFKKYRDFSCMCCNFSHGKASGRREYYIARWYHGKMNVKLSAR